MHEAIVSAALKTLNIDAESVSGELTEDQIKEFTDKIASLKVYDDATLNDLKSNVRKDFRKTIESEVSGKTLGQLEKNIMQKYGVEFKQGEDYQNAVELIEKIVDSNVQNAGNPDETLTKELTTLREALKSKTESFDAEKENIIKEYKSMLINKDIDAVLNGIASKLDVADELKGGQLEFIKYTFNNKYSIGEQDGQTVVLDANGEVVKNETDYSPRSLSSVLNDLAPTLVKFKTDDNKVGRADEKINGKTVNDRVFSTMKSQAEFNKYLSDNSISPTSLAGQEAYAKWRKAQNGISSLV